MFINEFGSNDKQFTEGTASEPGDIRLKVHRSAHLGVSFNFFKKTPALTGSLPMLRKDWKTDINAYVWNEH